MQQLVEPFVMLQTYPEYASFDLKTKLRLCRVRITKLMENPSSEEFRTLLVDDPDTGLNGILEQTVSELEEKHHLVVVKQQEQSQ